MLNFVQDHTELAKYMQKISRLLCVFFLFFQGISYAYDHCPDLMTAEDYSDWQVFSGQVTGHDQFYMVLTRGNPGFDAVTQCKYNKGQLTLFQPKRAIPINPILWSPINFMGFIFNTCAKNIDECGFTLVS